MMHYEKCGRGKAIVLIHGFGSDSEFSYSNAKNYLKGYKLIMPDLPGHGKSAHFKSVSWDIISRELDAILKKEKVKQCVLVGHSLGGITSLNYYLHRKKMVRAIILLNSTAFYKPNVSPDKYAKNFLYNFIEYKKTPETLVRYTIKAYNFIKNIHPKVHSKYLLMIFSHDLRKRLRNFDIPSMVIQSENDTMITKNNTEETARLLNAKLFTIPGPHDSPTCQPVKVYSHIKRFLKWIKY